MVDPAIRPARRDEWEAALGLLVPHESASERDSRVQDVLESVTRGEMSLDGLLVAERPGKIVGAGLSVLMPDGIAFVWPPACRGEERSAEGLQRHLLNALSADVESRGAVYAQILLDARDPVDRNLLEGCAYRHVADLETLERDLTAPLPERRAMAWEIVACDSNNADRFARVIDATYVGSLDCPGFTGRRSGSAALESHRLAGVFDPSRWLLFEMAGGDVGVLLQTVHPDLGAWEIVYTGVVPEARRKGVGRAVMIEALHRGAAAGCRTAFLAVDAANSAACELYARLGFVATARKCAWVRWPAAGIGGGNPHREHSGEPA